jgi:alpha-tubulin suppressor-like RCC1 family protein
VKVAGGHAFNVITAGRYFTCAIDSAGELWCWGMASGAQLGRAATDTCDGGACAKIPLKVGGGPWRSVAAGVRHACAVDNRGVAHCWGFNHLGETGTSNFGSVVATPAAVNSGTSFVAVQAGDSYTCALSAVGRAYCWGANNRGELGRPAQVCTALGPFQNFCSPVPGPVETAATFSSISSSNSHVCAITAAGTAYCWGDNGQGQLGRGTFIPGSLAEVAQPGTAFTTIGASSATTCATPVNGSSVCWGLNLLGKLGNGTRTDLSTSPVQVSGSHRFVAFAGGDYHMCALTADGSAYCWGSGAQGQLGGPPLSP